jgi:hypothetical protein
MKKRISLLLLLTAVMGPPSPALARDPWEYKLDAPTIFGPLGYTEVPSAKELPYKDIAFSVNRYVVGTLFGWPKNTELGMSFDLTQVTPVTPLTRKTYKDRAPHLNFHGKYQLLDERSDKINLAMGFWRRQYYMMASPRPWKKMWRAEAGAIYKRRTEGHYNVGGLAALSLTAGFQRVSLDYDSADRAVGAGFRYLLSDHIRININVKDIGLAGGFFDHFVLGLNVTL